MLSKLLQAIAGYFDPADDPTPGMAEGGLPDAPLVDYRRLWRLMARCLRELARNQQALNQQVQQNAADIAAIKAKLGL